MLEERWHFKMLGTFEVTRNRGIVPGIHRHKHCQLLAFLAYNMGKHSRASLALKFWPLSDDGDNNLSQALLRLTRILELPKLSPDTLLQSPRDGTLSLLSELFTRDIDAFNQHLKEADKTADAPAKIKTLTAAFRLYRGEFLLGYSDTQEYDWIAKARSDYRAKFVQALETLCGLFRELSLPELANVCEEHAANAAPLTADECTLLEHWNETPSVEPLEPFPFKPLPFIRPIPVINPKAVASYNQGRRLWKIRAEGALQESLAWFQRAIDSDPNYALAYAGMADAYSMLGYYSYLEPRRAAAQAKTWVQAARQAAGAASDSAQSALLTADAWIKMIYDWEWVKAEEAFIEALQLNPNNETAHQWYSYLLMIQGNTRQSLEEINTACDLEPQSGVLSKSVGERYHYKRLYAYAIEKYRDALKDAPRYCLVHYCLGKAYEQQAVMCEEIGLTEDAKDKFDEALRAFHRAIELDDVLEGPQNPSLSAGIAHACAKSGERAKARDMLQQLKEQRETDGCYVSPVALSTVYLGLEEPEAALDCLDVALDEHPGDLVLIHIDPRFISLRSNFRFEAVTRKIGLYHSGFHGVE